jgi:hypothetical protein
MTRAPLHFLVCWVLTGMCWAQINTEIRLSNRQYLAGEPILVAVTVTNHAGRDLVMASDGRKQWLDFIVKDAKGQPVPPRKRVLFGAMKIKAGESLAKEIDLSQHYLLSEPGGFSVSGVVNPPDGSVEGTTTNRVFFNLNPGRRVWSQKVGLGGGGTTREYRLIQFAGDQKTHLYAEIGDVGTGQKVRTFRLGDMLTLRKPQSTVDKDQRMHAMFLATPSLWVHCVVNSDGKLIYRQIHQRAATGDPTLITDGNGKVAVVNSIPYDPKAATQERKETRKASDRPTITY